MALARFKDLCLDAHDAETVQQFWAAALDLEVVRHADGSGHLAERGGGLVLWLNKVPELHTVKNRVHLDVHCGAVEDLLALGATVVREPTAEDHWWNLADLSGNEFCAFVRAVVPERRLYEIVVDAADAAAQLQWWHEVLGGDVEPTDDPAASGALSNVPGLAAEYLVFQRVPEPKTVKNRVHWDVDGAVDDLVRHGARVLRNPTDTEAWHVLADPEGNEFCVFAPA